MQELTEQSIEKYTMKIEILKEQFNFDPEEFSKERKELLNDCENKLSKYKEQLKKIILLENGLGKKSFITEEVSQSTENNEGKINSLLKLNNILDKFIKDKYEKIISLWRSNIKKKRDSFIIINTVVINTNDINNKRNSIDAFIKNKTIIESLIDYKNYSKLRDIITKLLNKNNITKYITNWREYKIQNAYDAMKGAQNTINDVLKKALREQGVIISSSDKYTKYDIDKMLNKYHEAKRYINSNDIIGSIQNLFGYYQSKEYEKNQIIQVIASTTPEQQHQIIIFTVLSEYIGYSYEELFLDSQNVCPLYILGFNIPYYNCKLCNGTMNHYKRNGFCEKGDKCKKRFNCLFAPIGEHTKNIHMPGFFETFRKTTWCRECNTNEDLRRCILRHSDARLGYCGLCPKE